MAEEKKGRPSPPTIPGNPLMKLVQARLRHFRTQPLTTIRTVRDVATLMEVASSTLNTYLNGRRRATDAFCERLATVLGIESAPVQQAAAETWAMRAETHGES